LFTTTNTRRRIRREKKPNEAEEICDTRIKNKVNATTLILQKIRE
jgi:hypothetical protein